MGEEPYNESLAYHEHYNNIVDAHQEMLRVDKYLLNKLKNVSRNKIQLAAKAGTILVNQKPVKANYRVRGKDEISILLAKPYNPRELKAENIPLDFLYEDEDIVVLNKQAGLVVHPGVGNYSGTLVNGLKYYFDNLPSITDQTRPGLVHRLDKDTSGIMVIAKNEWSMTKLAQQFFDRTIDRKYHALVWGDVPNEEGTIEGAIGRDTRHRKKMTVFPDGLQGKHAVTHYKVLERFGYVTLVECKLETGRTHQIRVHMKYKGHVLFGDKRYGGDTVVKGTIYAKYKQFVVNCLNILPRQALHAKSLGFKHPTQSKEMHFENDLPEDFNQILEKWRIYARAQHIDLS